MIRLKERKILATVLIALLYLSYYMLSLDFLSTHFLGTSSGSVNLNSPLVPSLVMIAEFSASGSNSSKKCQIWICQKPWDTKFFDIDINIL